MSDIQVWPNSSNLICAQSLICVSVYSSVPFAIVILWLPGRMKLAKAQECLVYEEFRVVLFFEVPEGQSWRKLDLVFDL